MHTVWLCVHIIYLYYIFVDANIVFTYIRQVSSQGLDQSYVATFQVAQDGTLNSSPLLFLFYYSQLTLPTMPITQSEAGH